MINNKKRESGKHFLKYRLNRMEILNYNSLINLSVENNQKYSNVSILYKSRTTLTFVNSSCNTNPTKFSIHSKCGVKWMHRAQPDKLLFVNDQNI